MTDIQGINAADTREEIFKYLGDIQTHYGTYHNHKETSAWAGVVVYAAILVALINASAKGAFYSTGMQVVMVAMVVLVFIVTVIYLREQFSLRRRAADLVAASFYLRSKIIGLKEKLDASEYGPRLDAAGGMQSSYVLPEKVLDTADDAEKLGQRSRQILEICAYAIVSMVTLTSIIVIIAVPLIGVVNEAKAPSRVGQEAFSNTKEKIDSGKQVGTSMLFNSQTANPSVDINVNVNREAKDLHSTPGAASCHRKKGTR